MNVPHPKIVLVGGGAPAVTPEQNQRWQELVKRQLAKHGPAACNIGGLLHNLRSMLDAMCRAEDPHTRHQLHVICATEVATVITALARLESVPTSAVLAVADDMSKFESGLDEEHRLDGMEGKVNEGGVGLAAEALAGVIKQQHPNEK